MKSHVLVPFDGSEHAERGLERAVEDHPDAAITVLSVVDPLSKAGCDLSDAPLAVGNDSRADGGEQAFGLRTSEDERSESSGSEQTEGLRVSSDSLRSSDGGEIPGVERFARERGVDVRTVSVVGTPAAAIIEYADEHEVDAIVMGTHGRSGLSRLLFGSVAETVARRASAAVTLVK